VNGVTHKGRRHNHACPPNPGANSALSRPRRPGPTPPVFRTRWLNLQRPPPPPPLPGTRSGFGSLPGRPAGPSIGLRGGAGTNMNPVGCGRVFSGRPPLEAVAHRGPEPPFPPSCPPMAVSAWGYRFQTRPRPRCLHRPGRTLYSVRALRAEHRAPGTRPVAGSRLVPADGLRCSTPTERWPAGFAGVPALPPPVGTGIGRRPPAPGGRVPSPAFRPPPKWLDKEPAGGRPHCGRRLPGWVRARARPIRRAPQFL